MAEKFYCIKLIKGSTGERGYVIDRGSDVDVEITFGDYREQATKFTSPEEAKKFIRERKLEKGKTKAYVRDNDEIAKEIAATHGKGPEPKPIDKPLYYAENVAGEKMFYNEEKKEFYFKKGDEGYPAYPDKDLLVRELKKMNFPFDVHVKLAAVDTFLKEVPLGKPVLKQK